MTRSRFTQVLVLGTALSLGSPAGILSATNGWDASSGLLPDQIAFPFTLFDTAVANPVLSGGVLTLTSTLADDDILGYRQRGTNVSFPATTIVIEAQLRFVSSASTVNSRAAAGIQLIVPGAVTALWFEPDVIFLAGPGLSRGPSVSLDTDGAFHTYRLEVSGTNVGSTVNVYYDSGASAALTGSLVASVAAEPEITWGDLSGAAGGVSEWKKFQHNASAVPTLTIVRTPPGQATISWSPATPGFALQENLALSPESWSNSPSGTTNPVTVPATLPAKFYRLFRP